MTYRAILFPWLACILSAGVVLALSGCAPPPPEAYVYSHVAPTPEERAAVSEFVIRCATAANPHSDEEGEDLVAQCAETARSIHYGTYVRMCRVSTGYDVLSEQRCDRATGPCVAACGPVQPVMVPR